MSSLVLLFVFLLLAPLLIATLYFKTRKGNILGIRQDYVRDVRYFGHSFAGMVEKALPNMKNGELQLSRKEQVLEIGSEQIFEEPEIEKLVIVRNREFCPKGEKLHFRKEIYCEKDAHLIGEELYLRAAFSRKRILLGNGTEVVRWVDADGAVAVYDHCDLGRSVSSGEQLVIGFDNIFHSLFAPQIRLGVRPEDPDEFMKGRDPKIFRLPVITDSEFNAHYISDDMISEEGLVPYTIITRLGLKIVDGIILQGDIHSDHFVRVMEGGTVLGNIFAEKDILLEKNTTVLGNVFTQGDIFFEEGACVGQPGKISSVIARGNIQFTGKNYVYGYISSEAGGRILPQMDIQMDDDGNEIPPIYCFPGKMKYQEEIRFRDLIEYGNVDAQGFRLDMNIKRAEIPFGAREIPESQFFGCGGMEEISLPVTLTSVEAYAFADCLKMRCKEDLGRIPLRFVGISAFENCENLECSGLPDTLESIEGAAFAGCSSLKTLVFSDGAALKKVGDHAFRSCTGLTKVSLPDRTEYVGVSAFLGCTSLKEISLPETVKEEPGVKELAKNCPGIHITFREVPAEEES